MSALLRAEKDIGRRADLFLARRIITFIPLTLDERGAVRFIQQIQVGMAGAQGTAVGDGIDCCSALEAA